MKLSEFKDYLKEEVVDILSEQDEDIEVDDVEDVDVDIDVEEKEKIDVKGDDEVVIRDRETLPADEEAVQKSLKVAYDSAKILGDDILTNQIANTITYFTRNFVIDRSIDERKNPLNELDAAQLNDLWGGIGGIAGLVALTGGWNVLKAKLEKRGSKGLEVLKSIARSAGKTTQQREGLDESSNANSNYNSNKESNFNSNRNPSGQSYSGLQKFMEVFKSANTGKMNEAELKNKLRESFASLVKKVDKQKGIDKEDATKIAGAIAAKKMKGAGSGPTAKQKKRFGVKEAQKKN